MNSFVLHELQTHNKQCCYKPFDFFQLFILRNRKTTSVSIFFGKVCEKLRELHREIKRKVL
jgi:hypothetical protein